MSRINKIPYLVVLVLASLACGLITNPLNDAQSLASTAEALATSQPLTTLQAMASSMPLSTLEALPSSIPAFAQYLNPVGTPVKQWNNIPIMTQATAGQEFDKNTYSFKASGVTATDVQNFYSDQLKTLGWTSSFSAQGGTTSGGMLFTKDSNTLTIVVTSANPDVVVILVYQ